MTTHYTEREKQVLAYIAGGMGNKEIAERMGLNQHTTSNYTAELYSKTGAENREELFNIANRWVERNAP